MQKVQSEEDWSQKVAERRKYRIAVCRMTLVRQKRKKQKVKQKIKWWEMEKEGFCVNLREESRQALVGREDL